MNKIITNYRIFYAIIAMFFIYGSLSAQDQDKPKEEQPGLVGVFFDHSDFTGPVRIWKALSLNSSELDWPEHKDFSVQWQGSIEGPVSGPVTFSIEANNGIWLEIDGKVIINSWSDKPDDQGVIEMKKGVRYKIRLHYKQISGPSYLRLFWMWRGEGKKEVASNLLHFTSSDKMEMQAIFRKEADLPAKDLEFDISTLLSINNQSDLVSTRAKFSVLLFGEEGFPMEKGVDLIEEDIQDPDFKDLQNLEETKKLIINMEYGLNSIAYHFIPVKSNKRAVLYHQGHNGKFSLGISTIQGLLSKGFHVVGISMPLKGMNSQPIVHLKRFGKMNINSHGRMGFLDPEEGHPVKYFVEPVFRVINYLHEQGFKQVNMTGISGGGWTTTLCAAMDTRIKYSYPVAGSLPLYLRIRDPKNGSWGDYEQIVPELYRIANYLELYVMGASGSGRRQIQFLNEFDACCFSGTGYATYEAIVSERVNSLGDGNFEVFLDSSHEEHKISEIVLNYMLNDLEK